MKDITNQNYVSESVKKHIYETIMFTVFLFLCVCSGGSILSTRCSETYETKTALMSLFGLPLWYFSQSPRVVIQVSRVSRFPRDISVLLILEIC